MVVVLVLTAGNLVLAVKGRGTGIGWLLSWATAADESEKRNKCLQRF
jgi:hypothetical protein